ncbi:hypothetical protein VNO77_06948 [Canavalia gladiata]|uniref:Uncharacterized protein n=1 Tax=Canavalia gladiata TaxID=3824 RepID=A0AAN9M751_CANGL
MEPKHLFYTRLLDGIIASRSKSQPRSLLSAIVISAGISGIAVTRSLYDASFKEETGKLKDEHPEDISISQAISIVLDHNNVMTNY